MSVHYLILFGQTFTMVKVNKDLNQLIISKCIEASLILKCFLLQVHLVFHGIILTIRTCFQADCIDFMCIFRCEQKRYFYHITMVLKRLKIIIFKGFITVFVMNVVLTRAR